jgi:hypothetical protein
MPAGWICLPSSDNPKAEMIPSCDQQGANWYGGGEAAARKFLKNQASPVFQKL